MQSDSPEGPEEVENEADWFLSASVIYKIGESALHSYQYAIILNHDSIYCSSNKDILFISIY
jgi:hypothetical protein